MHMLPSSPTPPVGQGSWSWLQLAPRQLLASLGKQDVKAKQAAFETYPVAALETYPVAALAPHRQTYRPSHVPSCLDDAARHCRPLPESVLQLVLGQLLASLGKGDVEAKQAAFEASGGLQLIQQLGDQGHRRLARLVAAINFLFPEQVSACLVQ